MLTILNTVMPAEPINKTKVSLLSLGGLVGWFGWLVGWLEGCMVLCVPCPMPCIAICVVVLWCSAGALRHTWIARIAGVVDTVDAGMVGFLFLLSNEMK